MDKPLLKDFQKYGFIDSYLTSCPNSKFKDYCDKLKDNLSVMCISCKLKENVYTQEQ